MDDGTKQAPKSLLRNNLDARLAESTAAVKVIHLSSSSKDAVRALGVVDSAKGKG